MANDFTGLDQFLANNGYQDVQPSPSAQAKPAKKSSTKYISNAENQAATATLEKTKQDVQDAATRLQTAMGQYKMGALSKADLNDIFNNYIQLQDKLYTMDAPASTQIHEKFFPSVNPAVGAGTKPASAGQTQELRYDAQGNSLVPGTTAYATGLKTKPIIPTAAAMQGKSTGGIPTKSDSSGAGAGAGDTSQSTIGGFVPLPKGKTFGDTVGGPQGPQTLEKWSQQYGGIGAMALTIPWMRDLLGQAVAGGWTAQKFTDSVKNYTDPSTGQRPWDQIGQAYRDSTIAYYDNKQAWGQQYNDKLAVLQQNAIAEGYDPTVFGTKLNLADPSSIDAAYKDQNSVMNTFFNTYYNNMPDITTIQQWIANHSSLAKTDQNVYAGVVGQNADTLKSYASDMGVAPMYLTNPMGKAGTPGSSGDFFLDTANLIQQGKTTMEEQQNYIKQQAMSIYKPFANRINEGMSVKMLASPYLNAAGNLLEVDPSSFDLGSSTGWGAQITKAMQGDSTTPMSLDSFMTQVKQSPDWLKTTNARNSIMDTATQLLRNFGMVVGG